MRSLLLILALITLTGCPTGEEGSGESTSECHKDNGSLTNVISDHTNHHYYHELDLVAIASREGLPCKVAVYTIDSSRSKVSGRIHYIAISDDKLQESELEIKLHIRKLIRDYHADVSRIAEAKRRADQEESQRLAESEARQERLRERQANVEDLTFGIHGFFTCKDTGVTPTCQRTYFPTSEKAATKLVIRIKSKHQTKTYHVDPLDLDRNHVFSDLYGLQVGESFAVYIWAFSEGTTTVNTFVGTFRWREPTPGYPQEIEYRGSEGFNGNTQGTWDEDRINRAFPEGNRDYLNSENNLRTYN